jgi:hypothetical protein
MKQVIQMRPRDFTKGSAKSKWRNSHASLRLISRMPPTSRLMLGSALLCLFAWTEPSIAQINARCIYFCRYVRGGQVDGLGFNMCLHNAPICTGQPFDADGKEPSWQARAKAVAAAACGADDAKFCRDVKPGGGRRWACLAARKNELSPACQEILARRNALN